MNTDEYIENEINNIDAIKGFISNIKNQSREMILTSDGDTVGAIITGEQYSWFLDQLDAYQDTGFIEERAKDKEGSQSLEDFKKEIK